MKRRRFSLFLRLRPTRIYAPGYNTASNGLNWGEVKRPVREDKGVVKGRSKRVIVVKSPDKKFFEQAIFILREDFIKGAGIGEGDVLREAERVADEYVRSAASGRPRFTERIPRPFYAALGAAAALTAVIVMRIVGIY